MFVVWEKNVVCCFLMIVQYYIASTTCTTFRIRFLLLATVVFVPAPRRIFSILTTPATLAKRVWSFPIPTLSPARNFCPRCRTRMDPALAGWLWRILTPSLRPIESRPLFVDPPAFFVAIPRTAVMVVVFVVCCCGWKAFAIVLVHEEGRFANARIMLFPILVCFCSCCGRVWWNAETDPG
jgi:hypothetical protein